MKALIMILVLVGSIMIVAGIYEQKLKVANNTKKIEYKFIPRTYFDEQTLQSDDLMYDFIDRKN
jgi:hypothetical protein